MFFKDLKLKLEEQGLSEVIFSKVPTVDILKKIFWSYSYEHKFQMWAEEKGKWVLEFTALTSYRGLCPNMSFERRNTQGGIKPPSLDFRDRTDKSSIPLRVNIFSACFPFWNLIHFLFRTSLLQYRYIEILAGEPPSLSVLRVSVEFRPRRLGLGPPSFHSKEHEEKIEEKERKLKEEKKKMKENKRERGKLGKMKGKEENKMKGKGRVQNFSESHSLYMDNEWHLL